MRKEVFIIHNFKRLTIMKKVYLLIAAFAGFLLTSCTSDDFVGESPQNSQEAAGAINFGGSFSSITRTGDKVGADAATLLQSQFVVFGTKHAAAETGAATNDEVVFKNYKVEYTANSAGTTLSNTHNWEYVGLTPYASTIVSPAATSQGIKYWDYSADAGYTFYAFASMADLSRVDGSGDPDPLVTVTKTSSGTTVYDKGYSMVIKNGADLDELYVADRKPVAKDDYNKPVTLKFRNFGSRVRVGFYETIPGYKVKITKFYIDADASTTASPATAPVTSFTNMIDGVTTNFAASLQNINTSAASNTISVSYYDDTDAVVENHVKLTPSTVNYNYSLQLGAGVLNTDLGISSAAPTWDNSGNYTTVYPFEQNVNPMLIKVDYTLTAEDGNPATDNLETIEVKGANVVVPAQYVQWKSNFAYTYLFKIGLNTNGSTDPDDPTKQGLYPITFDAVVVDVADDKTQETITNFEDYSITTYSNGSNVTTDNEYKKGNDIYVVKVNNNPESGVPSIVAPSGIGDGAGEAQVYVATTTGDAINEATIKARITGTLNGITLTATTSDEAASLVSSAPAADGTEYNFTDATSNPGAVKFTPGDDGYYVYVFTRTVNVAPTYLSAASATYSSSTVYYFYNASTNVYFPAAGIDAVNFDTYKADLYTQTAAGTAGVYDVKVIKVVD